MSLHALVLAAHPDDAELALGGLLLRWADGGRALGVVDLTRGERATRGTPERRAEECARASELLGLALRANLGAPDGALAPTPALVAQLERLVREHAPRLVLSHHPRSRHPDHAAAAALARAVLARLAPRERPAHLRFLTRQPLAPELAVDVGPVWERKLALLRCYASQLEPAGPADRGAHLPEGRDLLARADAWSRRLGAACGIERAEGLVRAAPAAARETAPEDLDPLFESPRHDPPGVLERPFSTARLPESTGIPRSVHAPSTPRPPTRSSACDASP